MFKDKILHALAVGKPNHRENQYLRVQNEHLDVLVHPAITEPAAKERLPVIGPTSSCPLGHFRPIEDVCAMSALLPVASCRTVQCGAPVRRRTTVKSATEVQI